MFRRIDWWIGRHMTTHRWISVWLMVSAAGLFISVRWPWLSCLGAPMAFFGALGVSGNWRRLR